jgi:hypothetical protein
MYRQGQQALDKFRDNIGVLQNLFVPPANSDPLPEDMLKMGRAVLAEPKVWQWELYVGTTQHAITETAETVPTLPSAASMPTTSNGGTALYSAASGSSRTSASRPDDEGMLPGLYRAAVTTFVPLLGRNGSIPHTKQGANNNFVSP